MTPEQEEAVREWRKWEDEWDWDNDPWVGGIWFLRGLGYPPDLEKLAEQEAEIAEWLANGGLEKALAEAPTAEEMERARFAEAARLHALGVPVPPYYLPRPTPAPPEPAR